MVSFRKNSDVYFFTATNYNWLKIVSEKEHKEIIINSLRFLSEKKRVKMIAFVIMPNHIHIIWQVQEGHIKENIQRDFLK